MGNLIVLLVVLSAAPAPPERSTQTRLPIAIRDYLNTRGYRTVPGLGGCNVFRGQFLRAGQTDVAVSCVDDSTARLFVFPAGAAAHVEEVVREVVPRGEAPAQFFKKVPCTFTRATLKTVRYFHEAWSKDPEVGDEAPSIRPVRHDGIEQWVAECCSVIHYWHAGRWWKITGMD